MFAVATVLSPAASWASNGAIPRTAPVFHRQACLSVVDRSVDPVFVLDVSIPYEDTALTPDELPDSRRFQFFGLCRQPEPGEIVPNWVTASDAERSLAAGLIDAVPTDAEILERAAAWSPGHTGAPGTCVVAMNASDLRLPITCEALAGGVAWDTRGVAVGNYVVAGYTFEPALNLWVPRRGVVQVRDDDRALPVVSLTSPATAQTRIYEDSTFTVEGCMDGPAGTQVSVWWATAPELGGNTDDPWRLLAERDASECALAVTFDPPPEAVGQAVLFRAVVRGPGDSARWVSYSPYPLLVYPGAAPDDAEGQPVPGPGPDACGFFASDDPSGASEVCPDPLGFNPPPAASGCASAGGRGAGGQERPGGLAAALLVIVCAWRRRAAVASRP